MKEFIKRIAKGIAKDYPIYLNGYAVGMLLFLGRETIGFSEISLYLLAILTFFQYGKTKENKV
jgi:hypothetical protein